MYTSDAKFPTNNDLRQTSFTIKVRHAFKTADLVLYITKTDQFFVNIQSVKLVYAVRTFLSFSISVTMNQRHQIERCSFILLSIVAIVTGRKILNEKRMSILKNFEIAEAGSWIELIIRK